MTTEEKIIKNKLGLLRLAEELGNVSQACKIMGYSRDSFYRFRELYAEEGEAGIHSQRRVRHRVHTTDSNHCRPVAPNVLQRDFSASAPNQKWVGDILAVSTNEGWLYVAALLDTFSRRIVGLAMSAYRDEALVMAALQMALGQRMPTGDLIHHTDRGSQYTADDYLALLKAHGVTVSMSGKGDPYDNAMIESFFSTLRAECTKRYHFAARDTARLVVFEYVMVLYNRQRLHSSLGFLCPLDFEADYSP